MGSSCSSDSSIMPKMVKMSMGSSKIYGKPSATTWFVRDRDTLLEVDQGNRWCNKWRSTIKDVRSWLVPSLSHPNKWNNLFRQDAGQNILHSGQRVSDITLWQPKSLSSIISVARVEPSTDTVDAKAVSEARARPF